MKTRLLTFIFLSVCMISQLDAQIIVPRFNQGAILEPKGKIINGAGQDLASYLNYWNVMHTQNKPLMYMTYLSLRETTSDWADGLKADLMSHPGKFQVPQIGLSMTSDGNPSTHYEQDVAAGLYDKQISMFIDGLQSMAHPAFVRIGYEFNGVAWNGYVPATYKSAFIRITNMIRARGVEVATVWNFAMDGVMNYMDYYPGDEYVDWWGINLFSASHFSDANAKNFMDNAGTHKKPVMIGETTPRNVGVLSGQQSWNQWFVPFFTFIHTYPELKAFSYINWDWSQYSQWSTWGDGRLEKNAIVSAAYANEIDSLKYLHASSESDFRKTFGSSDMTAPATPGTISIVQSGFPLQLNWNAVTDPSGLSHYIIYKNGALSDYTLLLPYSDKNIAAGEVNTYAATAMDRAGNESLKTSELQVTVPSTLIKSINGEFDSGTLNWQLSSFDTGAAATMKIDSSSLISGRKSCAITISKVSGTNWHIQLWQWLSVRQGRKYRITFKAKASATIAMALSIQKAASPYTTYLYQAHTLTATVQTFTDEVTINTTDQAKLEFYLGSSTGTVWIDAVSISEIFAVAPTVSTDSITNITTNSAKIWGNVSSDGSSTLTERGIVYSTAVNPTTGNGTKVTAGSATGVFSSNLTGLPDNTLHHVRAYAINAKGTSYGDDKSFTTKIINTGIGVVSTNFASELKVYPNPFQSTATIHFRITEPGFVSLKVTDALGTEVATLVNEKKQVGDYLIEWNARGLVSGIYFCTLQKGNNCETKKMLFMK